jgi:hypothetical protein
MMAATTGPATPTSPPPEIREATRATDGSGGVIKGALLTQAQAEARRQAGLDIVVCGQDAVANRLLAADIESAAGPWKHHLPNLAATGPRALPHFQQRNRPPAGHSFYETASHKAL